VTRVNPAAASIMRGVQHFDPSQLWFQLEEIVERRTYLRHGVRVRDGDVVLDVGANVGVAAIFFASECRAGLVHSFEPVAPLFALLRENLAPYAACVPHACGLGSKPGQAPITYYPGAAAMSGLYADPEADRALVLIRQIVVEVHDEGGRVALVAKELRRRRFRVATEQEALMRGTDVHVVYAARG